MQRSDDENYHGLVAESYDLFRGDDPVEQTPWFQFYRRRLEERPGLALEAACGTGRILLPFLRAGFEMEGVDSSPEMLAICRDRAKPLGLKPVLYEKYMQEMNLPQTYATILIPLGSFILIGQWDEALEALRRFHRHLRDDGQLVFSMPGHWNDLREDRREYGDEWSERRVVTRPSDGTTITLRGKNASDRLDQTHRSIQRYELRKDGQLLRSEEHESVTRWYGKHEMTLMLQSVGFRDVRLFGNHTEEEATSQHTSLVYRAIK